MENISMKGIMHSKYGQISIRGIDLELEYEELDSLDETILSEAAECLADTFAGIGIDGVRVSEPMVNACGLSKEDMFDFIYAYLKNVADQGYCFIAKDSTSKKIVGVAACEIFNPSEEIPVFEGNLEPMNKIISLLTELDERFVKTIEYNTGKKVVSGEYIHAFMCGAKLAKYKRLVIAKLTDFIFEKAMQEGFKGIFLEATNKRSADMMVDYFGFYPVNDPKGRPILTEYSSVEAFKSIPPNISTDCRILYKALHPAYEI